MRLGLVGSLILVVAGAAVAESAAGRYAQLAVALQSGDGPAIERLLDAEVDANFAPEGERSLLRLAISAKNHAAVRRLLALGADLNRQEGFYKGTAIMFAADNDDREMVDLLLAHGARIDSRDGSHGDAAIHWAAYAGHFEMVRHLLDKGADPTIVGQGNALEIAMRRGFQPLVELLAEARGQTRAPSEDEASLARAIAADDVSGVGRALTAGASADGTDRFRRPLLAAAARAGQVETLRLMLDAGAAIDAPDPIGYTALMEAARDRQVESVRLLLARGANPNHLSAQGGLALTPLHLAAIGGSVEVIELLVAKGAALDVKCAIGTTPLLWGLFEGKIEGGIRLIELGADPTIGTSSGYTASDFAADGGNAELAAAIAGWQARRRSEG